MLLERDAQRELRYGLFCRSGNAVGDKPAPFCGVPGICLARNSDTTPPRWVGMQLNDASFDSEVSYRQLIDNSCCKRIQTKTPLPTIAKKKSATNHSQTCTQWYFAFHLLLLGIVITAIGRTTTG